MKPNSIFMFHEGDIELHGTRKQIRSTLAFDKYSDEVMYEIYASRMKHSGKYSKWSKKKIKDWLKEQMDSKEDVWLTAKQTVDLGLADEIFTSWRGVRA